MRDNSLDLRFWPKVSKGIETECWEWQGALNGGYGWVHTSVGPRTAQRVAAYLSDLLDDLTNPLHVLHKCDNPKCCNPSHLFLGTNQSNVNDRTAKGRGRGGSLPGQKNGASKLTDLQIYQIRDMYQTGDFSQSQLSQKFGVRQPHISRIVNRVRCGEIF
jgi:hypothetical protein